jgi:HKD family nuclease
MQAKKLPVIPRDHGSLSVASTRVATQSVDPMDLDWIRDQIATADEVSIAAGFYDVTFIEHVLQASQAKRVRLLFNGMGGRRLAEQSQELHELVQKLSHGLRTVEVRLAFAPGMFHSKLFLISQGGVTRALVGSANATWAAFSLNEELLISLPQAGALAGYFDAAWIGACPLHAPQTRADSLINFFRTGVLYFKPVATLGTSINPFRDLFRLMNSDERAALGGVQLPYADQATGIGPFNLKQAVQSITEDPFWDELEDGMGNLDDGKAPKLSIRPWSIETCFGYWVPNALDHDWHARLEDAGSMKRERLKQFRAVLVKLDKELLVEKYREYLAEVRGLLTTRVPRYASLLNQLERNPFDEAYFERFVARIIAYLEDTTRLKRLAEPFISGGMPEIWEDVQAYRDFRASFFDYLDRVARLPGNKPKVARIILERLDIDAPLGGEEEWSDVFGEFLEEYGWTDDAWTERA